MKTTRTVHKNIRIREDVFNAVKKLSEKNAICFSAQLNMMLKQQADKLIGDLEITK
jgi:hypothetical protein